MNCLDWFLCRARCEFYVATMLRSLTLKNEPKNLQKGRTNSFTVRMEWAKTMSNTDTCPNPPLSWLHRQAGWQTLWGSCGRLPMSGRGRLWRWLGWVSEGEGATQEYINAQWLTKMMHHTHAMWYTRYGSTQAYLHVPIHVVYCTTKDILVLTTMSHWSSASSLAMRPSSSSYFTLTKFQEKPCGLLSQAKGVFLSW